VDFFELARQLVDQKASAALSVQYHVYHYGTAAVLCGGTAHAAEGVSGQGVNSALMDAVVLGDWLDAHFDNAQNRNPSLEQALLQYSQQQALEGKAHYDLFFGPKPKGLLKIHFLFRNLFDTLFLGRLGIGQPPLQTLLSASTKSFSGVRRNLAKFYDGASQTKAHLMKGLKRCMIQSERVEDRTG
jgi:2-polyprenyl-6-methoxyphenol hydroxylase-like FAD-dependent oxidoreductase